MQQFKEIMIQKEGKYSAKTLGKKSVELTLLV